MLIRSFFEVEILGPYFMASFIVYYGLFKLSPLPGDHPEQNSRLDKPPHRDPVGIQADRNGDGDESHGQGEM